MGLTAPVITSGFVFNEFVVVVFADVAGEVILVVVPVVLVVTFSDLALIWESIVK